LKDWSSLIIVVFDSLMVLNKYENTKKYIIQVKETLS
jgi:hypothetical protein